MDVSKIKSLQDAENYCEGILNDFSSGISSFGETMAALRDYTFHLDKLAGDQSKNNAIAFCLWMDSKDLPFNMDYPELWELFKKSN